MSLRSILKNWPYKLLALGTAITLSSYVQSERNPWQSVSVLTEIKKVNVPKDCDVTLGKDKVLVTLHGRKSDVETIKASGFDAQVDFAKASSDTRSLPVKICLPDSAPQNLTWDSSMRNVAVAIEARSTKTLPLDIKLKTSPPIGYAASSPAIDPESASVSGRSSVVRSVSRLVITVNPTPIEPSVDEEVDVKALDVNGDEVKNVTIEPNRAHVAVKLVEAPASKSVFIVYNVTGQPQFPYKVTKINVSPSSVTIMGRPESLAGTGIITTDEIDIDGANSDVVRRVGLHVPPGLKIDGPREVSVTIKIAPEKTQ